MLIPKKSIKWEISDNLVRSEYLGLQKFFWHVSYLISYFAFVQSTNFFFSSESVSVALG